MRSAPSRRDPRDEPPLELPVSLPQHRERRDEPGQLAMLEQEVRVGWMPVSRLLHGERLVQQQPTAA